MEEKKEVNTKEILEERLDEKCKGCMYDENKEGGYACLSCVLIGQFIPRKENENEKR